MHYILIQLKRYGPIHKSPYNFNFQKKKMKDFFFKRNFLILLYCSKQIMIYIVNYLSTKEYNPFTIKFQIFFKVLSLDCSYFIYFLPIAKIMFLRYILYDRLQVKSMEMAKKLPNFTLFLIISHVFEKHIFSIIQK